MLTKWRKYGIVYGENGGAGVTADEGRPLNGREANSPLYLISASKGGFMEGFWTAVVTSVFTFAGVLVTVIWGNKKNAQRTKEQTDLTLYRIGELEKKQDKYNHLQERVAKMELHDAGIDVKLQDMSTDVKEIKRRLFNE